MKILWLDNDRVFLAPHVLRLRNSNHEVDRVRSISEFMDCISNDEYDLLIIDVMLPLSLEEEEMIGYAETDEGRESGLAIYNYIKKIGKETPIMIFTIREDNNITKKFEEAGLESQYFKTKPSLADAADFLTYIQEVYG